LVGKHGNGFGVSDRPSLLVRLRLLLSQLAVLIDGERSAQRHNAVVQVHIGPPKRAQLASSSAERHRTPDEGAPVRVFSMPR
jgi:hypothetical protein